MVNRLWQYHFGRGLVDTPSDFGCNGGAAVASGAARLAGEPSSSTHGWSLKHMHRLIVLSATYRQSSAGRMPRGSRWTPGTAALAVPAAPAGGRAIRDAILAVSGKLDLRMGGPGFDLFEPNDNYVKVYTPKKEFGPAEFRRMVYQIKPRMQLDDTFGAFDCPDARPDRAAAEQLDDAAAGAQPAQQPVRAAAGGVLRRAAAARGRRRRRGAGAARLSRWPSAASRRREEARRAVKLDPTNTACPAFCRALLNANEFLYVD